MSEGKPSAATRPCGRHVELASNESTRITQCPCGTLYVTLVGPGVTVRMNEEILRGATAAFISATDKVDEAEHPTIN